ncbi:MAG: type II toxin-antitoxin system HicA family toxin [Methanoregula sp.]
MLPVINGKELVTFLETLHVTIIRQKGSHVRMKSDDGRYTPVPVHSGEPSRYSVFT